jgi:hypothetical protein
MNNSFVVNLWFIIKIELFKNKSFDIIIIGFKSFR